jgi:hypothetical protein
VPFFFKLSVMSVLRQLLGENVDPLDVEELIQRDLAA